MIAVAPAPTPERQHAVRLEELRALDRRIDALKTWMRAAHEAWLAGEYETESEEEALRSLYESARDRYRAALEDWRARSASALGL